MNSKRDRIDRIISNLYISKKSKHRQYTISLTRKRPAKDDKKVKETMPKKISIERWGKCKKPKLSRGPGFFQKTLKKCCVQKPDDWQRLSMIAWGRDFEHSSGKTLKLTNTFLFDNFFQILYSFYSMNIHHMRKLFETEADLLKKICEIAQLLLTESFVEAKVCWLINICSLTPDVEKGNFNAWGTDKQLTFYHIRDIFCRSYHFSCSSDNCPSKDTDISACTDVMNDMILHAPSNTDYSSLTASIQEWEQGSSHNALVSCKERFQQQPNLV